jgi:hypothetical protein
VRIDRQLSQLVFEKGSDLPLTLLPLFLPIMKNPHLSFLKKWGFLEQLHIPAFRVRVADNRKAKNYFSNLYHTK